MGDAKKAVNDTVHNPLSVVNPIWGGSDTLAGGHIGRALGGAFQQDRIDPSMMDPMRPEYRGLSMNLADYGNSLLRKGPTFYNGPLVSKGEYGVIDNLNNMIKGSDGASLGAGLIKSILSGDRLRPESNPFLNNSIDFMRKKSNEGLGDAMNLLDAAFARSGMTVGSGRSNESMEAARRFSGDLSGQISSILSNNYQQGLGEQMGVLSSVLPNLYSQALGANSMVSQRAYNDFVRRSTEGLQNGDMARSILQGAPQFQFSNPQFSPSTFQQILGGAGSVGQALLPFMLMA